MRVALAVSLVITVAAVAAAAVQAATRAQHPPSRGHGRFYRIAVTASYMRDFRSEHRGDCDEVGTDKVTAYWKGTSFAVIVTATNGLLSTQAHIGLELTRYEAKSTAHSISMRGGSKSGRVSSVPETRPRRPSRHGDNFATTPVMSTVVARPARSTSSSPLTLGSARLSRRASSRCPE